MTGRCTATVYWWDIGVTVGCVRPDGHQGLHRDGTRWFDDAGFQRPHDPARQRSRDYHRLSDAEIRDIRARHAAGQPLTSIARSLRIGYVTVRCCALRLTYKDVA